MAQHGTLTGVGTTPIEYGNYMDIMLMFDGTASVDVEVQMPQGDWLKIDVGITSDYHKIFSSASGQKVRLNCTAHTDDVKYALLSGARP